MSAFRVLFEPGLPPAPPVTFPFTEDVNWHRVLARIPEEFNLIYLIGTTRVAYYPAQLIAIVEDLRRELGLVERRVPHTVLISGYPVLDVEYQGQWACFFHADELSLLERSPIHASVTAVETERALRDALRQVWSLIKFAERS